MTKNWTTVFIALITSLPAAAQTVNCPATADTWVSVPEDRRAEGVDNHGTDTQLPIRGRESLALFQFDVSGLKGRRIGEAVLKIHRENADPVPIHTVGISTISGTAAWAEGARKNGPAAPGESNYFFARVGQQPWSYPGSDVTDVTFGQGGSLYSYERARDAGNGWYEIDVPAGIVAALVSGDQFGIMLTDEKGQTHTNHLINSRESQYPPVLIVSTSDAEKVAPGRVQTRPVETTPAEARKLGRTTLRPGSVILNFGGAGNATRYEVRYSNRPITKDNFDKAAPVARWMLNPLAPKPSVLAASNSIQDWVVAVVEQLKPAADYYFAARAVSAAGNAGPVSPLGRFQAYDRTYPALPPASEPAQTSASTAAPAGALGVWAVPELLKINPRTAELLEKDYANYRAHNPVWDASSATVTLRGARNEFLAFQLAIESAAPFSGVEVSVSKPLFGTSKLPQIFEKTGAVQLTREWFVPDDKETGASREWYADALVPLKPLSIPSVDNPVAGQTVAPVFVDIYVPHDATPGSHTGELLVRGVGFEKENPDSGGGAAANPAGQTEFRCRPHDLHGRSVPGRHGARYSRIPGAGPLIPPCSAPQPGESQRPRVHTVGDGGAGPGSRARRRRRGDARSSWRDWDAHFGPMLDGSAFKDLPRSGVPVQAIFLPFFENWPGNLRKGYRFDYPEEIWTMQEYNELIIRHALTAGPIEEAFSRITRTAFRRSCRSSPATSRSAAGSQRTISYTSTTSTTSSSPEGGSGTRQFALAAG